MKEEILHFVWQYRLFDHQDLSTSEGQTIDILHTGRYNTDAGPDFIDARIRIGGMLFAGNLEIHVNAADWEHHMHHRDAAYNNVILHVVYEGNAVEAKLQNGQKAPVLKLMGRIEASLLEKYEMMRNSMDIIPCANRLKFLPESFSLSSWLDRLLIERLQAKTLMVEAILKQTTNDWDQVAFQLLATYYGSAINKEPFSRLAQSIPLKILQKHLSNPTQIEAFLFGQAGMLETDFLDEYPKSLQREYRYLRKLYALKPIESHNWKFFRIRPANFPTIKIAQLGSLLINVPNLFDQLLQKPNPSAIKELFEQAVNPYWQTHYQFDKPSTRTNTLPGQISANVLIINAVVPLLFSYGRYIDDDASCEQAIQLLNHIPAEDNAILRIWKDLGIKAKTAADSQALIQLKTNYCDSKRCLQCQIGHRLLKSD